MNKNAKLFEAIEKNQADKVARLLRSRLFSLVKPADVNTRHPEYHEITPTRWWKRVKKRTCRR